MFSYKLQWILNIFDNFMSFNLCLLWDHKTRESKRRMAAECKRNRIHINK